MLTSPEKMKSLSSKSSFLFNFYDLFLISPRKCRFKIFLLRWTKLSLFCEDSFALSLTPAEPGRPVNSYDMHENPRHKHGMICIYEEKLKAE